MVMVTGTLTQANQVAADYRSERFTPGSTIGEVLAHSAFDGFAERLLPRREDRQHTALSLKQLDALMPYHSLLNANDMADGLNLLVHQVENSEPSFFEFYSADEIQEDSTKAETGLFFLNGASGAPFAIIAPGGGFTYVATLHEGLPLAKTLAEQGFNAFVLKYRTGQGQREASEDLAKAFSYITQHYDELQVSRTGYSLWGASAGARLVAEFASYGYQELPPPACVVIMYTGYADYQRQNPPTFTVVGEHDRISPPEIMLERINALRRVGVVAEFHVFPGVEHGFALGTGSSAEGWTSGAVQFWRRQLTHSSVRAG